MVADLTHVVNLYLLLSSAVIVVTSTNVLTLHAESSSSFCSELSFDESNYI